MTSKKYPIVLVCKEELIDSSEPFQKDRVVEKVVNNDTEYHSFLNQHCNGDLWYSHEITERRASWKELKGNFFKKSYHWMPKWVFAIITYILGYFTSNFTTEIWYFIKSLIHH